MPRRRELIHLISPRGMVLRGLAVPVLVTQGRSDTVVLPAMAEHVLATCPTAEASWYEGVGHVPHLEEPGRFNRWPGASGASVADRWGAASRG